MARIRTIKPEFWRSPDVMGLSYFQRLLFIGLWNLADDHGRGNYDPSAIAADLFLTEYSLNPHGVLTDVSCAFAEYEKRDMVTVYHVKKRDYFQIANWRSHQKPNRPTDSKIPTIDQAEYIVHGGLTEGSVNTHGGISEDSLPEQGTGNREQGTGNITYALDAEAPSAKKRKASTDTYADEFAEWYADYPRKRSRKQAEKAFAKARKEGATVQELTDGLAKAKRSWQLEGRDSTKIPYPASWLNAEGWADEETTPQQTQPPSKAQQYLEIGQRLSQQAQQESDRQRQILEANRTATSPDDIIPPF